MPVVATGRRHRWIRTKKLTGGCRSEAQGPWAETPRSPPSALPFQRVEIFVGFRHVERGKTKTFSRRFADHLPCATTSRFHIDGESTVTSMPGTASPRPDRIFPPIVRARSAAAVPSACLRPQRIGTYQPALQQHTSGSAAGASLIRGSASSQCVVPVAMPGSNADGRHPARPPVRLQARRDVDARRCASAHHVIAALHDACPGMCRDLRYIAQQWIVGIEEAAVHEVVALDASQRPPRSPHRRNLAT